MGNVVRLCAVWLLVTLAILPSPALAIEGVASVIDGDTIEIHGQRIRFFGIDAPEGRQTCQRDGKTWRCGQRAALVLAEKIGRRPIKCDEQDRDRYQRIVATCYLAGEDLNGWMVSQGWALDYAQYSKGRYSSAERAAKIAARGIWVGEFEKPWDWRKKTNRKPSVAQSQPRPESKKQVNECHIKGNISSRGERIYHVPGGQFYDRTRIDVSKGERWFCSEVEARSAGWRRSKR